MKKVNEMKKALERAERIETLYNAVLQEFNWRFRKGAKDEDGNDVYDEEGNRVYVEPEDKDSWEYENYKTYWPLCEDILKAIEKLI